MELTFLYIDYSCGNRPVDGFPCHFHTAFRILGERIIKLAENGNGLGRLENNRVDFIVDRKQENKSNMQATDLKF